MMNTKRFSVDESCQSTPHQIDFISFLPPEIKLMISDKLPYASKILFALTAKAMYRCLCPVRNYRDISEHDLMEVLLHLEKDNPDLFICFSCKKLWPFKGSHPRGWLGQGHTVCPKPVKHRVRASTSEDQDRTLQRWEQGPCFKAPLHIWRPTNGPLEVSFAEAHLVMMNYHHGSLYGLPLKALAQNFSFSRAIDLDNSGGMESHFPLEQHMGRPRPYPVRPKTVWDFEHRYSANIIDNELYVTRRHKITGPVVAPYHLARLMDNISLPICNHIYYELLLGKDKNGVGKAPVYDPFCLNWSHEVPEFKNLEGSCLAHRLGWYEPTGIQPWNGIYHEQGRRSCPTCSTDYDLTLQCNEDSGWNVILTTFHRLGQCRTMDDTWLSFNSFPVYTYEEGIAHERDTTYVDGNGIETIPFALPYHKSHPHVPGIWRDMRFTRDRKLFPYLQDIGNGTIRRETGDGLVRKKCLQVIGIDLHDQRDQEWTSPEDYVYRRAHDAIFRLPMGMRAISKSHSKTHPGTRPKTRSMTDSKAVL